MCNIPRDLTRVKVMAAMKEIIHMETHVYYKKQINKG